MTAALLGLLLGALAVALVRRLLRRRRNERALFATCVRYMPGTPAGRLSLALWLNDNGLLPRRDVVRLLDDGERERVRLRLVREDQRARERGL